MTVAQWSASEANFYETTTFYSTFYAPAGGNNSARTVIDTKDAPNNAIVHFVASVGGGTPTPGQWVVSGEADQYTILVIDGINPITKKIPNPAGDNCHANPVIQ
jgi:hypothetical protein